MPISERVSSLTSIGTFGSSSRSCLMYQSVLSSDRLTTRTSGRTLSTACVHHNGNVSLSPLVKTNEFFASGCSML